MNLVRQLARRILLLEQGTQIRVGSASASKVTQGVNTWAQLTDNSVNLSQAGLWGIWASGRWLAGDTSSVNLVISDVNGDNTTTFPGQTPAEPGFDPRLFAGGLSGDHAFALYIEKRIVTPQDVFANISGTWVNSATINLSTDIAAVRLGD